MGKLEWVDSLSVGVKSIDDEHKRLIKIANSIIKISCDFSDRDKLTRAMSCLREYTVFHFSNEEAYMASISCPELTKHSAEHARLKRVVKEFPAKATYPAH
ncbi:bacteriohemerythrin [Maridesulfovibrio frigidus]|uniref:bacteriohemerythrin n=1 Tax=Maridesulfovibrio frigidus TaxID=340956 RepID=UPI00068B45CC|nr:hemerythrin domain-containing protein [Maridesulfovibrio frigidus]